MLQPLITMTPFFRLSSLLTLLVFGLSLSLFAQDEKTFDTYTYTVRNDQPLELDVYSKSGEVAPTVIFVHGGGFYAGTRKEKNIDHFCDSVSNAGYTVVNMSYHLYLEGQSFHCDQPAPNKVKAFESAASDIYSATLFLLENAAALNIEPDAIFLSGSSAGAEAVLQATFAPHNQDTALWEQYPSFQYKGVMAFAGAMTSLDWIDQSSAIPVLLYHGTCDALVPYASAPHHYCPENTVGALLLHGSYSIYERYAELEKSCYLVSACGGKHGSCIYPIEKDITQILSFMDMVLKDTPFLEHRTRHVSDKACKYPSHNPCK